DDVQDGARAVHRRGARTDGRGVPGLEAVARSRHRDRRRGRQDRGQGGPDQAQAVAKRRSGEPPRPARRGHRSATAVAPARRSLENPGKRAGRRVTSGPFRCRASAVLALVPALGLLVAALAGLLVAALVALASLAFPAHVVLPLLGILALLAILSILVVRHLASPLSWTGVGEVCRRLRDCAIGGSANVSPKLNRR